MGITTTWTCDKCKHSQNTKEKMFHVLLYVQIDNVVSTINAPRLEALWCRRCVESVSILPVLKNEDNKHVVTPCSTLEDIIREIVQSEMQSEQR